MSFPFGKYKNQSIEQIAKSDPGYIVYVMENVEGERLQEYDIFDDLSSVYSDCVRRKKEAIKQNNLKLIKKRKDSSEKEDSSEKSKPSKS